MDILGVLNLTLATGSLLLGGFTIALYLDYFVFKGRKFSSLVNEMAWPAIIALSVGSTILSLVYSEYFGFIPCSLCWLQRIALYPQALMAVLAFKISDNIYFPVYGIWLSVFGFGVAIYQYLYQMLPSEVSTGFTPCLLDVVSADCAVKVIDEFGFVTFPFISAITFAFLIVIYLYTFKNSK